MGSLTTKDRNHCPFRCAGAHGRGVRGHETEASQVSAYIRVSHYYGQFVLVPDGERAVGDVRAVKDLGWPHSIRSHLS